MCSALGGGEGEEEGEEKVGGNETRATQREQEREGRWWERGHHYGQAAKCYSSWPGDGTFA